MLCMMFYVMLCMMYDAVLCDGVLKNLSPSDIDVMVMWVVGKVGVKLSAGLEDTNLEFFHRIS